VPSRPGRVAVWSLSLVVAALAVAAVGMGTRAALPPAPEPAPALALTPSRTLTVATVGGALPLSGTGPDGRAAGLHVAVARAVCERLDIDCRFTAVAPDGLVDALASGAVDMIAADLVAAPARAARVHFAPPHARAASLLLGRAASWTHAQGNEFAMEHLAGRVVVTAAGSDQAQALRRLAPAGASVVLATTQDEALAALRRGEADAAFLPLAVAMEALGHVAPGDALVPLGPPRIEHGAGGPVALATGAGDGILAEAVDAALTALRDEGRLRALARLSPDPLAASPHHGSAEAGR